MWFLMQMDIMNIMVMVKGENSIRTYAECDCSNARRGEDGLGGSAFPTSCELIIRGEDYRKDGSWHLLTGKNEGYKDVCNFKNEEEWHNFF